MRHARGLVALALALAVALAGVDVAAATTTGAEEWRGLAPRALGAGLSCERATPSEDAEADAGEPSRIVGQVVALDTGAGVAMLATVLGMLALEGTPEAIAELGIGDTVIVEMVDEEPLGAAASACI
jgi:hypothetical protein